MIKKVLLLTDELRVGGAETYFFKIENNLKSKNIELITAAEDGEYRDKIKNNDSFIYLTKSPIKNIFKIIKVVRDRNIDVIHANSLRLTMISIPAKILNKNKIKLLYTKHNLTYLEQIGDKVFSIYVNLFVDKLLTVCEFEKKRMMDKGVKEKKIRVVSNSTDSDEYKFNSHYINNEITELKIGILARLSEVKNHMFFIDIIESLQKSDNIKFEAYIAGDGDLREKIKEEIEKRNLNIKMIGNVVNPYEFLSNIDVSLLVSHREVFPMSVIEALSVGTIVVSMNVGGVSDCIINNETGYLIEDYDCDIFLKIIEEIYYNKEKNTEIILNGRNLIENKYSLNSMINGLEKVYLED